MSRIAERRRIVKRAGLALLALASTTAFVSACIFDQGNYQGGGRTDNGRGTQTATNDTSTTTTPPPPPPTDAGLD